jgi:hypothetical protein
MGFNLAILLLAAQGSGPALAPEDYRELTDTRSEVVNFFPEPSTAMAFTPEGALWTINPYASTVQRYAPGAVGAAATGSNDVQPDLRVGTGLNPVALAVWDPEVGDRVVLVVCAGTHGVFVHRASDGLLVEFIRLETASPLGAGVPSSLSEGGDIVIDPDNGWAFVSCPSTNSVVQIDLAGSGGMKILQTFSLPVGQRPGPLVLERTGRTRAENRILVAMTVTGNDSTFAGFNGTAGVIVDISNVLPNMQLPDFDAYRLNPATGAVQPSVTGAGSLLFDMELHPQTGRVWMLSTDSINSDPALNTEPLLRGRFAVNQLAIADNKPRLPLPIPVTLTTDLDDTDPSPASTSYSAATSVNQARTLAIHPDGQAYTASPFLSSILRLQADGSRDPAVFATLPQRAQCWDLELGTGAEIYALCLGTMTIEVHRRVDGARLGSLDLGFDPTSNQVRRGRDVFLDGTMSQDSRFSCATCHPGGKTDQLGWPISNDPIDHKDVMLTQSLLSIADTFPHHWRGERDLKDFQGAFGGLLGAGPSVAPTDDEMDDLIAFILSLQAPANPLQNPERILDDSRRTLLDSIVEAAQSTELAASSALQGQNNYFDVPNFSGRTCQECHTLPTGSDSNMNFEVLTPIPRESNIEVPHLRQLQHRGYETIDLSDGAPPVGFDDLRVNVNGFGAAHNGGGTVLDSTTGNQTGMANTFDFLTKNGVFTGPFTNTFGAAGATELISVFRFVDQFDQGISPATHWAQRVTPDTKLAELDVIEDVLIDGCDNPRGPWNEVVFFGTIERPSGTTPVRAYLGHNEGGSRVFLPDDPSFAKFKWGLLRAAILGGIVDGVVMGLPLGNGLSFANDFDRDGIFNYQDDQPWNPDGDNDGLPDGMLGILDTDPPRMIERPTLDFQTARLAKYHVQFNEDVVFRVEYQAPGGPLLEYRHVRGNAAPGLQDYTDTATFVLTHDHPSGDGANGTLRYAATLYATDRAGNPEVAFQLPTFSPDPGGNQFGIEFLHIESVAAVAVPPGVLAPPGTTPFAFEVEVAEDELAIPGQAGFAPAVGVRVFVFVAKENLSVGVGDSTFAKVPLGTSGFLTNHPTAFDTTVLATQTMPASTAPYLDASDFILSEVTDAQGRTTVVFFMHDTILDPSEDIQVAVQGTLRPTPGSTDPLDMLRVSLGSYQPLKREGVSVGVLVR